MNATASDILKNKTAYVNGDKITGTIESQPGGVVVATTSTQTACPANNYASGSIAVKGDANLKPKNIKSGVTIFGVEGTYVGNQSPNGKLPDDACLVMLEVSSPTGCNVYGGGVVSNGMTATVSAEAQSGYKLTSFAWKKGSTTVSSDKEYTFTVEDHTTLVATFTAVKSYTINATVDPQGTGTGTITGAGQKDENTTVTLIATGEGELDAFVGWYENGELVSENATYTFTATKDVNLVAKFRKARIPTTYTELKYIVLGPVASMSATSLASAKADQTVVIDFEIMQFPNKDNQNTIYYNPTILSITNVASNANYNRSFLWLSSSGLWCASNENNITKSNWIQLSSSTATPQRISLLWDGPNTEVSINGNEPIKFTSYGGTGSRGWQIATSQLSTYKYWEDASVRIYEIKITSEGSTSTSYNKEYIPAKQNSNGRIGFYNTVGGNFIYNTAFTAGPVVSN